MTDPKGNPEQLELPLPFPDLNADVPLLPARMVNEYQYCPRLAYLEWVQGEWEDSGDTVDGRFKHRRVDRPKGDLPKPEDTEEEEKIHARSITLSSNRIGLIARMDLVEGQGNRVTPVDYKRGKRPHVPKGAYDPERVQLCVQGLLLEEHGYRCEHGVLYFVEGRERVKVEFDKELRRTTANAIDGMRLIAAGGRIPQPLEDSPKCPRCSLVGICLPDEVNFFRHADTSPRPMAVGRDPAMPVYVQAYHAKVGKKGNRLEISIDDKKVQSVRLMDTSQLALFGNIYVTAPVLHELMARNIPISWHSFGGWFMGHSIGTGHKNVEMRTAQYRASFNDAQCLHLARGLVDAKVRNCRTLLRRNWKGPFAVAPLLEDLQRDTRQVRKAPCLSSLLGYEGTAASRYFGAFKHLIRDPEQEGHFTFEFQKRNRRPPTDPVNAMLSFAYTLLVRTWTVTLSAVGFDPYRGFYHQPRYGRPALALDMMEPFRPLISDSAVIQAINNGEVRPTDFIQVAGSVNLTGDGRKRFIATFERRLSHEITHPLFKYRVSYRGLLEIQARLLGRYLLGELPDYPHFTPR